MKNGLNRAAIARLARNIEGAWPEFDSARFVTLATSGLKALELKERVAHVATALAEALPKDFSEAAGIIVAASESWDRGAEGDPLRGFAAWPLCRYIANNGAHDFKRSMAALPAITHLFSGEFAVRVFIARYPKRAFAELMRWTKSYSEHVRRLASEGCRPRLPWATQLPALIQEPTAVLKLLEALKDDPSLYVRRSVANNLNDIAKDHPDRVIEVCEAWSRGASQERQWIVRRATRTLVKSGHPRVWGLLGYTLSPRVIVSDIALERTRIPRGGILEFTVALTSKAASNQRMVVDYSVHFVKANGSTRPKVFKLKPVELAPRETISLRRHVSFAPISTRKYYPGGHAIEVLVNGETRARAEFDLLD